MNIAETIAALGAECTKLGGLRPKKIVLDCSSYDMIVGKLLAGAEQTKLDNGSADGRVFVHGVEIVREETVTIKYAVNVRHCYSREVTLEEAEKIMAAAQRWDNDKHRDGMMSSVLPPELFDEAFETYDVDGDDANEVIWVVGLKKPHAIVDSVP